jgi:hypothetical protein
MWNGVLEEKANARKEEIEERELKASADAIKAKTEAVSDAINAIENATFDALMAKEKANEEATKIANQLDYAKYTEEMVKAMANHKFTRCGEKNVKVGDYIFGLKKQSDGTYKLEYKCIVGDVKIVQEFRETWAWCGDINVTCFFDQYGNPIESIQTLFKQVMINMALSDIKVGDKAYAEDGTEAGIVTRVSFEYSDSWTWADGPTKTKMVKIDTGDLVEASNFYIKV